VLVGVQLDGVERTIPLGEFEDLVRAGTVGPHTPVRVDALTGGAWVPAGSLALVRSLADSPEARMRRAWARPAVPWATALLCGLALRAFLWTRGTAIDPVESNAATRWTPAILEEGESWRLLSHAFLHGDLGHIANNLAVLAYVGVALETMLGAWGVLGLFVVSAVGGGSLAGWLSPEVPSIGASGADFGFIAAAVILGWRWRDVLPERARARFGLTLFVLGVWALVNGFRSSGVDNWAHVGGLLAGALYAVGARPGDPVRSRRLGWASIATVLTGLLLLVGFGPRLVTTVPVEDDGIRSVRPEGWEPGWARTADGAWVSPTGGATVVVRTRRTDAPTSLPTAQDALRARVTAEDPTATVATEETTVDGVPALRGRWTGADWTADSVLVVRGTYVHLVWLEAVRPALHDALAPAVLAPQLTDPRALIAARDTGDGARARAARARALADLGRTEEALALLPATEAAVVPTRLGLLVDAGHPDAVDAAQKALATWPDDRRVWRAALAALEDLHHPAAGPTRAAATAKWPGDRGFASSPGGTEAEAESAPPRGAAGTPAD